MVSDFRARNDTIESTFSYSVYFSLALPLLDLIHRKGKEYIELAGKIEGSWFATKEGSAEREEVQKKVDELIKSTQWWDAYCGAVKAKILSLVSKLVVDERYEQVVLVMVCIKGGPVTEVEARNMETLRKECLEDLGEGKKSRPKGMSLVDGGTDGLDLTDGRDLLQEMAHQRAALTDSDLAPSTFLALKTETVDWFGDLQSLVTGDCSAHSVFSVEDLDGMDGLFRISDLVDGIVDEEDELPPFGEEKF
jgi:hypothetical protein